MSDIKIESEFKYLLPPLTEEQIEALEKDIMKNGCLTPLITWQNILIDGHHRYEICIRNNIPFDLAEMEFKDKLEAMEWAWSNQKNRRNLNKYELAQIALKFKPAIEAKAKENLTLSEGRGKKGCQKSDKVIEPIDTKKELAKIAGVSHDTIHKVEVIEEQAPNDIKKQVRAGDLTINNAYVLTKSAMEAKQRNEEDEKLYNEQLEKETQEREEKQKQAEFEASLPKNTVVLDKFREPAHEEVDYNSYLDSCKKVADKFNDVLYDIRLLEIDSENLNKWKEILDTNLLEDYLELANEAIPKIIKIQTFLKEMIK